MSTQFQQYNETERFIGRSHVSDHSFCRLLDGYKTQKAEDKRKFEEEIGQIRNACSKAEAEKTQHIQRIAEQQATIDAQSKKVK